MLHETAHYDGGRLSSRDVVDDVANTFTTFDGSGVQTAFRPLTGAEVARLTAQANAQAAAAAAQAQQAANQPTLAGRAQTALTANTNFLAIGSPTNAQVLAQVQTLTKECNALIRLALGLFDSTAGT